MASGIFNRLCRAFKTFDQAVDIILYRWFPPGNLYAVECNAINQVQPVTVLGQSVKDILNDAFLWAVPKKRRSLERRMNRRYGYPQYIWKPHVPKTNILMCRKCGNNYEANTLCAYCYDIVKQETKLMQEAIQDSLGLSPVEQDVVVLYEGEKEQSKNFWKNQRIVELSKKRPDWFSQNLLQPTTKEQESDSNNEKPEDDSQENIKNN